jgi:hypothetical protein
LLVSSEVPPTIFIVTKGQPTPAYPTTDDVSTYTPMVLPRLSVLPTVKTSSGQQTTFLFAYQANDTLNFSNMTAFDIGKNTSTPQFFRYSFTSNNITLNPAFGFKMHQLTITTASNVASGTYEVDLVGKLDYYTFKAIFFFEIN